MPGASEAEVARTLAALSTREIVDALGLGYRKKWLASAAGLVARRPSVRLGRHLARFDARIAVVGLADAAREMLAALGAHIDVVGECIDGPLLVVTNHPGAFDALAIMAALNRRDTFLIASDRSFLRAMPNVARHLVFVAESGAMARARGFREARDRLRSGAAVVHFGAGRIEPDVRFGGPPTLSPWAAGTGTLAREAIDSGAQVIPAFVLGVHSPRAKRLLLTRWAEERGVTTIAPLLQATIPGFRDVEIEVILGPPVDPHAILNASNDRARAAALRCAVAKLTLAGVD